MTRRSSLVMPPERGGLSAIVVMSVIPQFVVVRNCFGLRVAATEPSQDNASPTLGPCLLAESRVCQPKVGSVGRGLWEGAAALRGADVWRPASAR